VVDYAHAKDYTLSIRVSADGFCFAVHHPERAEDYAFLPYDLDPLVPVVANLKKAKESLPMLQQSYGKVQLLLSDASCEVLPAEYGEQSALTVFSSACSVAIRFHANSTLVTWMETAFPGARLVPGLLPVLDVASREGQHVDGKPFTLCHLHGRKMDIVSMKGDQLLFVNTFDVDAATTALYYLLGAWQTLGLSQEDDTLTLVGRSPFQRELQAKISRFIRHIEEPRPAALFHTTELSRLAAVPFDLQALADEA